MPPDLGEPEVLEPATLCGPPVQVHLTESPFLIERLTFEPNVQLMVLVVAAPVGAARTPNTATVAITAAIRRILFRFLPDDSDCGLLKTLQVLIEALAKSCRRFWVARHLQTS